MTAARKLLADDNDPVLAAFRNAPLADEPETEEERAAFEVGLADIRAGRGRTIGRDEMRAKIEKMRREQAGG